MAWQWKSALGVKHPFGGNLEHEFHSNKSFPTMLSMAAPDGSQVPIHCCEPAEACKAVGLFQALSDTMFSPVFEPTGDHGSLPLNWDPCHGKMLGRPYTW